jgi:hypothetical protein
MSLHIGRKMDLPDDVVSHTFALMAMRGAGKSNGLVKMAEAMYHRGLPWVAFDPKGDWHGIRSSANGRAAGLPVPILGGLRGDVPLEFWYGAGDSFGKLDKAQALLLRALVAAWPEPLSDEDLEDRTGYAHTSGHFKNSLARIRSLELAAGRRDAIYVCETLGQAKGG